MAFLENAFAVLHDTDGDNDIKLVAPLAVEAEKKTVNRKNNNQQKRQSPAAPNVSRTARIPLDSGSYENRRGGTSRGTGRNNANGFNRFDNWQDVAPRNNNGQGNGYRRYNGQADGNKQYGGYGYGDHQNREGNGYHKVNRHSAFAGCEKNGGKQQEWCEHGGEGKRDFNKINGSSTEDQVLEADQQVGSHGQDKLVEDNSYKGDDQVENGGWNFVGDRRGTGRRGNYSKHGVLSRGKDEAPVYKAKESLNGNCKDSNEKNVPSEGEERTEVSNDTDTKQRNHEQVTETNESKNLIKALKEIENMTLEAYEKQLIEKRKALEALKQEERKVRLDKDFELKQLIGRKKEDFATKLNSEKEESHAKNEKTHRTEQVEKVRKGSHQPMSMAVFLKDFKRGGGGHGAYRRREYAVESNGISSEAVAIDIEDKKHFPCLSPLAKA